MKSSFNFESDSWNIPWPGRVSRYNIAYQTPPNDPMEGFAIGNGELGALVWTESSKIIIVLNRSDLWDEFEHDNIVSWKSSQEDSSTTLRHGCRIIIDFNLPIFETIYLEEFNGVLDISEGSFKMKAKTPFGEVLFSAFIGFSDDVLTCRLEPDLDENIEYEIKVERFGSRTFSHWYYLINRDPSIGLFGTESFVGNNSIGVDHELTCGNFAAGVSLHENAVLSIANKHTAKAILKSQDGGFDFFASVTSPQKDKPTDLLEESLAKAKETGYDELLKASQGNWKEFWLKSIVYTSDEYIDNLWHLAMYYLRCCQGGKYPGRFINANWLWYHDAQPWNFYYHWNQQCLNWPLNAAGHNELLDSYFDYRFNSLDYAREDAKQLLNKPGAFVSDVTDKDGKNSIGEIHNYTPIAQIAVEFWKQYCYTGDDDFLRSQVVPYIYEACLLFETLFEAGEDGVYHPVESCGFEGWIHLEDSIALITCGTALFDAAVSAFKKASIYCELAGRLKEIAANMCEIPVFSGKGNLIESKGGVLKLDRGMFKGDLADNEYVLAAGFYPETKKPASSVVPKDEPNKQEIDTLSLLYKLQNGDNSVINDNTDMANFSGIHTGSENAAVFPSGAIGLKDKNSPIFKTAINTAKLYAPEMLGWDCLPIMMARLGLGKQMYKLLQDWPDRWIFNPNGFCHYGSMPARIGEFFFKDRKVKAEDAATSKISDYSDVGNIERADVFEWQTWNFRHLGLEPLGVLACAVNESLLQSHEGCIMVFPALENDRQARFTLHAEGGFVVSSEKTGDKPDWISAYSKLGNKLVIANPWPVMYVYNKSQLVLETTEGKVSIDTAVGQSYLLLNDSLEQTGIEYCDLDYQPNHECKQHPKGNVALGKPRLY